MTDDGKFKVGVTYSVEIHDCCVRGQFISKVIGAIYEDDMLTLVRFENGVTFDSDWGGLGATEVE